MTDISRTNKEESRPSATAAFRADTGSAEPIIAEPVSSQAAGDQATRESKKEMESAAGSMSVEAAPPLFSSEESSRMRLRWESIQAGFVDEPRNSVQMADQIVSEAIKHLTEGFAAARERLEQQWDRGNGVSTEDLRLSLCRYKAFFERLLEI